MRFEDSIRTQTADWQVPMKDVRRLWSFDRPLFSVRMPSECASGNATG